MHKFINVIESSTYTDSYTNSFSFDKTSQGSNEWSHYKSLRSELRQFI